ncbi:hypothetical protein [Lysobacter fragariae]
MASKKARVLSDAQIDGKNYKPDDVEAFDEAVIKAHPGVLDADPAAVKYAEALKKPAKAEAED